MYALVTGAAKGIGRAIAAELASKNYDLLLLDIDGVNLEQSATQIRNTFNKEVHTLTIDLSDTDAPARIESWSRPFHHQLPVVVNNAGYGLNGAFEEISIDESLNIIDVNIKAQLLLSYTFIPVLKRFPQSYLLNVGSTTSYQSVPYLSIYAASKAFVISFTRSLRYELRNSPISVSVLSPGSTDTDFVNRARMGASIRKTADRFNMTPEAVAKIAVNGLFRKKAEIIPGFHNKLNAWLPKFFPKRFVERIAGRIYEPKKREKQANETSGALA